MNVVDFKKYTGADKKEKIADVVNDIVGNRNYSIIFGYDCIRIEFERNEIYSDTVETLNGELYNDFAQIFVNSEGNIGLFYDVGIIDENEERNIVWTYQYGKKINESYEE